MSETRISILPSAGLSRRLALAGGLVGGIAAAGAAVARSSRQDVPQPAPSGMCLITPQTTQGPYWFDPELERADITAGRTGVALKIALTVLDGASCRPLPNARVDIWHCDALGVYSGYAGQGSTGSTEGETFLRGWQATGADGVALFQTLYPGWYRGRTTHIHVKVFLDEEGEANVLTCQLFFPDALSEWIYENAPAYARPGETRDTLNRTDGIAQGQGYSTFGTISEQADHYAMTVTLGVDRSARSQETAMGPGGPPPGGFNGRRPGPPPGDRRGPPPEGFGPGGPGGPMGQALEGEARTAAILPKAP